MDNLVYCPCCASPQDVERQDLKNGEQYLCPYCEEIFIASLDENGEWQFLEYQEYLG